MYTLVENIMGIPSQYANSTVTYVAGVVLLLLTVCIIDMVYKLLRHVVKSVERR